MAPSQKKTENQLSDSMNPWISICAGVGVLAACFGLQYLVRRGVGKQRKKDEARIAEMQFRGADSCSIIVRTSRATDLRIPPSYRTGNAPANTSTRTSDDEPCFATSMAVTTLTGSTAIGCIAGGSLMGAALGSQLDHDREASSTSASNSWRDTGRSCAPDVSYQAPSPMSYDCGSDD